MAQAFWLAEDHFPKTGVANVTAAVKVATARSSWTSVYVSGCKVARRNRSEPCATIGQADSVLQVGRGWNAEKHLNWLQREPCQLEAVADKRSEPSAFSLRISTGRRHQLRRCLDPI